MIYGVDFQQRNENGVINNTPERVLISALNEANALDILSKYCEHGIGKITYFRMIAPLTEGKDGNVLTLSSTELENYFS